MKNRETFTNSIDLKPPFTLVIGRKKSVIKKPGRFVMKREHPVINDPELTSPLAIARRPIREWFQMFIDGKLFATTNSTGTQKPSAHVRLLKTAKGKRVEIHLVKKYTTLEG